MMEVVRCGVGVVYWRVVFLLPAASVEEQEEQTSFESEVVTVTRLRVGQGVLSLV